MKVVSKQECKRNVLIAILATKHKPPITLIHYNLLPKPYNLL